MSRCSVKVLALSNCATGPVSPLAGVRLAARGEGAGRGGVAAGRGSDAGRKGERGGSRGGARPTGTRLPEPRLGEQFLLCYDRIIDGKARRVEQGTEPSGVEVVDEDVRVYEDRDFCHARISARNSSSVCLRECFLIVATYSALSFTSVCP